MAWYVHTNDHTWGPFDEEQIVAWIRRGELRSGSICAVSSQQAAHCRRKARVERQIKPPDAARWERSRSGV